MLKKDIERIERTTRLARPFLWGLCPYAWDLDWKKGKGSRIEFKLDESGVDEAVNEKLGTFLWLTANHIEVKPTALYEEWASDICLKPGVEQVFKRLVIPQLKLRVGPETMTDLRELYMKSRIPTREFIKDHNDDYKKNLQKHAGAVIEINKRFKYVHRYGPLASIIFEDAAEWLEDEGLLTKKDS
jgi:hypothetical protein